MMNAVERPTADRDVLVQQWFAVHREELVRYARRRVGVAHAEDVASEVLLRAYNAAGRLDERSARPWLFGIAANVIFEHRRAEQRQWKIVERVAARGGPQVLDSALPTVHPVLVRALSALPAGQREALLLVVWGELSYEECAAALAVPVGTVRSRIARARTALKDKLEHDQEHRR